LRFAIPIIAALVTVAAANVSLAQSTAPPSPESRATCPPDVKGEPPTVGGGSSEPLSDKLARSKGVICPPAAVDREMQVTPPSGGHLKVIPPPAHQVAIQTCSLNERDASLEEGVSETLNGVPAELFAG